MDHVICLEACNSWSISKVLPLTTPVPFNVHTHDLKKVLKCTLVSLQITLNWQEHLMCLRAKKNLKKFSKAKEYLCMWRKESLAALQTILYPLKKINSWVPRNKKGIQKKKPSAQLQMESPEITVLCRITSINKPVNKEIESNI